MHPRNSREGSVEPDASTAERILEPSSDERSAEDGAALHARLENGVNRVLAIATRASEALGGTLGSICETLGWETARYWEPDPRHDGARLRQVVLASPAGSSDSGSALSPALFAPGEGLVGSAWQRDEPLWVVDVAEHPAAAPEEIARLAGCRSDLLLPLRTQEASLGVLEFSAAHIPQPDKALLQALGTLGLRIVAAYRRLAEWEKLRESDECSQSTFDLAAIGITHVADDGRLIHVNRRFCDMLGFSPDELIGRTVKEISHPDDADVTNTDVGRLNSGEIESFTAEKRYLRKDGSPIWVRITVAIRRDALGEPMYHISVVEDISQRKAAEERLHASEEFYHSTFDLAAIGISHVALDGTITHGNAQLCEMLGYTLDELTGMTIRDISHPEDAYVTDDEKDKLLAGEIKAFKMEKRYLRKDGTPIWVKITVAVKRAPNGEPQNFIAVVEDISGRKKAEKRIRYLATHDELTKLPNRVMFGQVLSDAVESAKRYERRFSVLFIDLDRFKLINDSLGHDAGDTLLREMSSRFKKCLRKSDFLARLGGDEFVVLARETENPEQVETVARKIISAALKPVDVGGHECRVTASIGISTFPSDGKDAQTLMKSADVAMYLAKEEGKNNFQFASEARDSQSIERLTLENALRRALECNELSIEYQPKVHIASGEIKGVEALLRWNSEELGSVSPARFIPLAEEMGLIIPIGKWVLKEACAQNMAWQREGLPPMTMAVNLSPRQFRDPDLLDDVAKALETTGMPPELLELEITEGMLMQDVDQAIKKLESLKRMSVRLSIDDFGTGYSSLAQLKRLPIDTLKVDRSFIRDLPADVEDKAITEAIISMGRTLGVVVIAEGVETAEQQDFLKSRECDQFQGFYFAKPAAPAEFAARLREHLAASQAS